jgi:hypothetical protein
MVIVRFVALLVVRFLVLTTRRLVAAAAQTRPGVQRRVMLVTWWDNSGLSFPN